MYDWKPVSQMDYHDALEILPPVFHDHRGFLQGEPHDHRICTVTGTMSAEYAAYVRVGEVCYGGPFLTLNEFRKLTASTLPQKKT